MEDQVTNYVEDLPDPDYQLTDEIAMTSVVSKLLKNLRPPAQPIVFGDVKWRPALVGNKKVCHVQCQNEVGSSTRRRIEAALSAGVRVYLAAPFSLWADENFLEVALMWDVVPVVLADAPGWKGRKHNTVSDLIAKERIAIRPSKLKVIAERVLSASRSASKSYEKGKLFESFLVLLLSQVSGFEIFESRYKNKTEEIDIVIRNKRALSQPWPTSPIIVVSAKNEAEPIGVPALNNLLANIQKRGELCRLGFLCSAGKIAWTSVDTDLLRYSLTGPLMIPLDGTQLDELLEGLDRLDVAIDNHVIKAALR